MNKSLKLIIDKIRKVYAKVPLLYEKYQIKLGNKNFKSISFFYMWRVLPKIAQVFAKVSDKALPVSNNALFLFVRSRLTARVMY